MNTSFSCLLVFLLAINSNAFSGKKAASKLPDGAPTFSAVVEKRLDGLDKDPARAEIMLFAAETPDKGGAVAGIMKTCTKNQKSYAGLCSIFDEPKASRKVASAKSARERHPLTEKSLPQLNRLNLNQATWLVGRNSDKAVLSFSQKLAEIKSCQSTALYTALGAHLEDGLPKSDYMKATLAMYEKAIECGHDEPAHRSAFRLGMLQILNGKCDKAISALDKIPRAEGLGFIHSRAQYWSTYCKKDGRAPAAVAKDQVFERFAQYPMSFHSVLFSLERDDAVFKKVQEQKDPVVLFRTSEREDLNKRVALVEAYLRSEKVDHARALMSKIEPSDVQNLEPHFRLYLGYLYHRTYLSLQKFQLMSQLFSEDLNFKTVSTLKVMYPLWRYEIVDNNTKKTDPLLVLSLIRQESAFQENAQSRVGARGLMQIMPRTAKSISKRKVQAKDLYDPELNVRLGTSYIDMLLKRYDGNVFNVLAAYNAGALRVDEWKKRYPTDNALLFMDLIPYRETREYVASILRNYYWYSHLYPEQSKRQFVFWDQKLKQTN